MSLIFGKLTNSFVNFGATITRTGFNTSDPTFSAAANDFRHASALEASLLTYIGIAMFAATYLYMFIWVINGKLQCKLV